jgi:hypothetical protein
VISAAGFQFFLTDAPPSVLSSTMMAEWGLAQANRMTVPFTRMGVGGKRMMDGI